MSRQELTDALKVIHDQLSDADHLDQGDVERLRQTMNEIQAALEHQSEGESLSEKISSSARSFEESHPVLTKTLGRVADMLQQMGI